MLDSCIFLAFSIFYCSSFTHSAIQHLSSALVNNSFIKGKVSDSRCHVVYAFNVEEIANQIVTICNFARDNSTVWKKEEWSKREWLTEEMSLVSEINISCLFLIHCIASCSYSLDTCKFHRKWHKLNRRFR